MGSQSKRKKGTKDNRSIITDLKRETDQDANRTALLPTFEGLAFSPVGITQTDYVDVTDTIDPLQTNAPGSPGQVTGLNVVTGGNDNTLNLSWTTSGSAGVVSYNIYRSVSSGSETLIDSSLTNSYSDDNLLSGTTYYYKVSAVNNAGLEGGLSVEDSATTTGTGDITPPAQVTGLTATVISGTQINLSWTASGATDFNHYDLHRSTTSGFTPASGNRITQPTTTSYNNTGLSNSTTYYYKVAAVDNTGNIGTYSTQASATTTGGASSPALLMHLDGNFTDSSSYATTPHSYPPFASYTINGFGTPGKFGSSYWRVSTPNEFSGTGYVDFFYYNPNPVNLGLDLTTGFSYSIWIQPTDVSALTDGKRRVIIENRTDNNNQFSLTIDSSNVVHFQLRRAGSSIKTQITGATNNSWHHIAIVFDAVADTVKIYRNGVAGGTSTSALEYAINDNRFECGARTGSGYSYFEGFMDELQYFKGYVLTSTQVTNLMNTNAI